MQGKLLTILAILLLSILTIETSAKGNNDEIKAKFLKDHTMGINSQGRKFIIAFPPNESQSYGNFRSLEVYVTSSRNTTVTLTNKSMGVQVTKKVEAMGITTFSSITGETSWGWEIRRTEVPLGLAFTLESPDPISVYVLNSKMYTSEGYLAIPVSAWGTDYIHCSFYDYNEIRPWASGFTIIAGYDNTKVRIRLKGMGKGFATTKGGHNIGDSWSVTLNKDEVYMVQGDGQTRGQFDMSGSSIIANKPIGLLSSHERCMIPVFEVINGRDHLIEMMPPVSAWGKKYATVEYDRKKDKGDYFRIVASQPNTKYSIKWYDLKNSSLIAQRSGTLNKAGDWREYLETSAQWPHNLESIRGMSVFEFDKPALVLQYDYSAYWDRAGGNYDPFMILVVPVEQFTKSTVFQTPSNDDFLENHFNIIAVGDTTDPTRADLKSIMLDKKKIWTLESSFPYNQIPGTNLFWAKINVKPGAHKVYGDTKFGGYIYGFSSFDTYGWPAAMAIRKLDEVDTLPPVIEIAGLCGDYIISASELRNGGKDDDPRQIDQGISDPPELLMDEVNNAYSYNFDKPKLPDGWLGWPPSYKPEDYTFTMSVIDKYADAFAVFAVVDRYGNVSIDSIRYEADSLVLDPEIVDFGEVRLKNDKALDVKLKSESDSTIKIISIKLQKGDVFTILEGEAPPEFDLASRDSHNIKINYRPKKEWPELIAKMDVDSLIVETECLRYVFPVVGKGVEPRIWVDDFNAGFVRVNGRKCQVSDMSGEGLWIRNTGTMALIINGYDKIPFGFELKEPTTPGFPIVIQPGGEVYLKEICFVPPVSREYIDTVYFESNADGPKGYSEWKGVAAKPGLFITGHDWRRRRLETDSTAIIEITNTGDAAIVVDGVKLQTDNPNFIIDFDGIKPSLKSPRTLNYLGSGEPDTVIMVPVNFHPIEEDSLEVEIQPMSRDTSIEIKDIHNTLKGYGFMPRIAVKGYKFDPPIKVGTTHPVTGTITITSTSKTSDLYVKEVRWANNPGDNQDFTVDTGLPITVEDTVRTGGEPLVLPVTFTPSAISSRIAYVEILSDIYKGNKPSYPSRDTIMSGEAFILDFGVNDIDYGTRVRCDNPTDYFTITNRGTDRIDSIEVGPLQGPDKDMFERITADSEIPQTLDSGGTAKVYYRFKMEATPMQDRTYNAFVEVTSTADGTAISNITGTVDVARVDLSMATVMGIQPGFNINDYQGESLFWVRADATDADWATANIDSFYIEITYNKSWVELENTDKYGLIRRGDALDNSWKLGIKVMDNINPSQPYLDKKIVVTGKSSSSSAMKQGVLFYPMFRILLAIDDTLKPEFGEILFYEGDVSRNECVIREGTPGLITTQLCAQPLRKVILSSVEYSMNPVAPNPVKGDAIEFEYSIGIDGVTRIEIINSAGEIVKTPLNQRIAKGYYRATIPTADLSSGVYNIRLISGPFRDSKKLVIAK